jgi:tetratricopeptide (TPR) repeat protein
MPANPLAQPNLTRVQQLRSSVALLVWGEPGVGKTHWVESRLSTLACQQLRVSARTTVSSLVGRIPLVKTRPAWLERRFLDVSNGRFGETKELAEFVAALLVHSAPIALHVEDLHLCDPESVAFWVTLAGFVQRSKGVALLMTSHSRPAGNVQSFQLEPLDKAASDGLLETTLGAGLPPEALAWFWDQAKGNVLFTLEYMRFATRQGWLWSDGQRWRFRAPNDARPPTSLEGLLTRLLETAAETPQAQRLLEVRAVLPEKSSDALWLEVSGLSQTKFEVAKTILDRHGVIAGLGLAHPLYGEVMLAQMGARRSVAVAQTALEVILREDSPQARALAVQLLEAAEPGSDMALNLLLAAAQDAASSGDTLRSALLEARAVAFAVPPMQGDLALKAALVLRSVRPSEALRLAQLARKERKDIETTLLTAELLVLHGEGERADELVQSLHGESLTMEWLPHLIALRVQRLDFAAVLELWRAHPELHDLRGNPGSALLRRDVAWAMIQYGELEPAKNLLEATLVQTPNDQERGALLMALAYQNLVCGELMHAEKHAAQAVAHLEPSGGSLDLTRALEIRAEVLENLGRFPEAADLSRQAVGVRGELGDAWGVCRAQLRLASALLELAEYEQSEELLLESRAILERRDALEALIVWDCHLAHLYAEWNPPHGASLALRHARDALRRARNHAHPTMLNTALAEAAWVEAWYGSPQQALVLSQEALEIAAQLGQGDQTGLETMARGAALEGLGQLEEARESYGRGVEMLRAAGLASAERYALEVDRLGNDAVSAERRIRVFKARGQQHAIRLAQRYFSKLQATLPAAQQNFDLQVLGKFRVLKGATPLRIQSQLGKTLLAKLLEARMDGQLEVSDLNFFDQLFPDLPERQARDYLKNLVYRLRTTLGSNAIRRTPTGYALGDVGSDAERFLETLDLSLWRGGYLEDLEDLGDGGVVRHKLLSTLHRTAEAKLNSNPALSVQAGRALNSMEPYDRAGLNLYLRALRASNNRRDLVKVYTAAQRRFLEVDVRLPSQWQEFMNASSSGA